jgi:hypothetical protein
MAPSVGHQHKAAAPAPRRAPAPVGPAASRRDVRRIVSGRGGEGEKGKEGEKAVALSEYELERLADGGVTLFFNPKDVAGWTDRLSESFGRYIAHVFPGAAHGEAMACAAELGVHWVIELPADVSSLPSVPVVIAGDLHAKVVAWFHEHRPDLAPQEAASGSYRLEDTRPVAAPGRPATRAKTISEMTTAEKLAEAVRRAIALLPGEIGERLKELLSPEAIAMMAGFAAAYVVSQVTPIGWVADIIVGGLLAATVLMVGSEVIDIVKLLIGFAEKASAAATEQDLDQAAQLFAAAVSKAGVDILMAILFHKAGKAANLKPPGPRSPGLVEVLTKGGAKVKVMLTETPATADFVGSNGAVVRVPVAEVPGNVMMMEGPKGSGAGTTAGEGLGGGRGAMAKGPAPEPAPKAPAELPGKKLAAAEALAKKKPRAPRELLSEAKKVAAGPEEKAAETPGKPAVADPRAAAKSRVLTQIDDARSRKIQLYSEIDEAGRRGKQPMSAAERAELTQEKGELARQVGRASEVETELRAKLAELELDPYQRARAYSFSDAAAKDVITRARGLDEMSGKPIEDPTIDHIVPIDEIVQFEGFQEMPWSEQQTILSRLDNLRLMERALNSSKGSKRWANWDAGRRAYGEAVWKAMVELEGKLRLSIQEAIRKAPKVHR